VWRDGEKITRPRNMREKTYRKHIRALQLIQHAINTGSRYRERDEAGQYCD